MNRNRLNKKRIFSELKDLCLDVAFAGLAQLLVERGGHFVGTKVFNSLKTKGITSYSLRMTNLFFKKVYLCKQL